MIVAPDLRAWHALGLRAPTSFWQSSAQERAMRCNGAGAADGVKVPNTMWGLDLRIIFDIHDWDYAEGGDECDRANADYAMLVNAHVVIEADTTSLPGVGHFLRWVRGLRASTYYYAVSEFGRSAFNYR